MSFIFPPEPAAQVEVKPDHTMSRLLAPLLADALSLSSEAAEDLAEGGPAWAGVVASASRSRWVSNVQAVLDMAGKQEAPTETPKELPDAGWLQVFLHCAGFACSALEIEVWGRLLALEVSEPKTVSRRTLQALHAMDLWELESFSEFCAFSFSFESGWRFMFEGEAARREIWSYGREIDLTQHWIDVGLLSLDSTPFVLRNAAGLRLSYRSKSWEVIKKEGEANPDESAPICYRKFTAVGQQISSALIFKTFNGYARNLIQALAVSGQASFNPLPDAGHS